MKNFKFTQIIIVVILVFGVLYMASPPFLRNALMYQTANIDDYKIFSNRTVIGGNYQAWDEAPGFAGKALPDKYIDEFEKYKTVAYLLIKKDQIIFEKYWDEYSVNSLSNSFSMAKSIVSLMIGIAIDEGYIDSVDDNVGNYLSEFKTGEKSKVTIRHLLEMSSGLSWDEAYTSPFSITTKGYYGTNLAELVLSQESDYPAGEIYEYKSGNTQLLGLILQESTGESLSAYASQKLWKPMGALNDALWSIDREKGVEKAFCCFNSNARDFARFGKLLLQKGRWNETQLISQAYLENSIAPVKHLKDETGQSVNYYGWQWWLLEYKDQDVVYMRGLDGQYVFILPESDMIIVRLGEKWSKERKGVTPLDVFTYLDAGMEMGN